MICFTLTSEKNSHVHDFVEFDDLANVSILNPEDSRLCRHKAAIYVDAGDVIDTRPHLGLGCANGPTWRRVAKINHFPASEPAPSEPCQYVQHHCQICGENADFKFRDKVMLIDKEMRRKMIRRESIEPCVFYKAVCKDCRRAIAADMVTELGLEIEASK